MKTGYLALAVGLAAWCGPAWATEWDIEMVAPGITPEIAVDDMGLVHLAWVVEDDEDTLFYGRRESDGWDITVAPSSGYIAVPLDLAIDDEGHAHIAYHEHYSGNAEYLENSGASWTSSLVSSPGHDGWVPSLALAHDATPHIASFDPVEGIEHAVRTGSQWTVESVGTGQLVKNFGAAIAVDASDHVWVCYHDGDFTPPPDGDGNLICASRGAGGWTTETVDSDGDVGKFVAIALDSQDNPHLVYLKWESGTSAIVRYAHRDGGSWVVEDVTTLDAFGVDFDGAYRSVSIAVDAGDRPHIAAGDRETVVYGVESGSEWAVETTAEETASDLVFGQFVSLALDPEGRPHIAFYEVADSTKASTGTVYSATTADRTERSPRRPSRRIGPSTAP
jgi:hypothetical protein